MWQAECSPGHLSQLLTPDQHSCVAAPLWCFELPAPNQILLQNTRKWGTFKFMQVFFFLKLLGWGHNLLQIEHNLDAQKRLQALEAPKCVNEWWWTQLFLKGLIYPVSYSFILLIGLKPSQNLVVFSWLIWRILHSVLLELWLVQITLPSPWNIISLVLP